MDQNQTPDVEQIPVYSESVPENKKPSFPGWLKVILLLLAVLASIVLWELFGRDLLFSRQNSASKLSDQNSVNTQPTPEVVPTTKPKATDFTVTQQLITNLQGLSNTYWQGRNMMKADDKSLYMVSLTSSTTNKQLFARTSIDRNSLEGRLSTSEVSFPSNGYINSLVLSNDYAYSTVLTNIRGDYPIFKNPIDIYMSEKMANGSLGEWKLAGTLPSEYSAGENGGATLLSNGISLLFVVHGDLANYPVYFANVSSNGKIDSWSKIGEIPADLSGTFSTSSQYQYHDSLLTVLSKNSIKSYQIGSSIVPQKSLAMNLPADFNTPYEKPTYFLYDSNQLYLVTQKTSGQDGEIQLWSATEGNNAVNFTLVKTQTGIGPAPAAPREFHFTHNSQAVYTLIQSGNSYDSTMKHTLSVIPLP